MRINTNVASLNAIENSTNTNKSLSSSLEKLSSGLAINKAADDASGLAIADKLRTQASSLKQGIANANSASAMIQIADKAMAEQSNILDIVKTKLIQASTSTTSADGREAIRKDVSKLLTQLDNIASQTNYNGTTLLQQSATDKAKQSDFTFQLGEDSTFDVTMSQGNASNTNGLGGGSETINLSLPDGTIAAGAVDEISTTAITAEVNNTSNNIAGNESLTIKQELASDASTTADTTITLTAVDVLLDGSEQASTTTGVQSTTGGQEGGMDINISGKIGGMIVANADATFDLSNQTDDVQNAVKALVATVAGNATYDSDTNVVTFSGAETIDFGDIEFSNAQFRDNTAGAVLELNAVQNSTTTESLTADFTITNNHDDPMNPQLNQINIGVANATAAAQFELKSGNLLSDLKNLEEGGLTAEVANKFMETIDESLTQLNSVRSDFGSTQNQLESSIRNMQTTHTNLKNAEGVIRDTDYAAESANFNKQNIIAQAGTYAMSQANAMAQNVQKLLQ
jgi:flagellin